MKDCLAILRWQPKNKIFIDYVFSFLIFYYSSLINNC